MVRGSVIHQHPYLLLTPSGSQTLINTSAYLEHLLPTASMPAVPSRRNNPDRRAHATPISRLLLPMGSGIVENHDISHSDQTVACHGWTFQQGFDPGVELITFEHAVTVAEELRQDTAQIRPFVRGGYGHATHPEDSSHIRATSFLYNALQNLRKRPSIGEIPKRGSALAHRVLFLHSPLLSARHRALKAKPTADVQLAMASLDVGCASCQSPSYSC
jgi:hypothetical protein